MNNKHLIIQAISYGLIFLAVWVVLTLFPLKFDDLVEPWAVDLSLAVNLFTAMLFTLFVWLTARLARTDRTIVGILGTALFLFFFCPGGDLFFECDEAALTELASQCIVPFFISQYNRVSQRDFHRWYLLMLLMGIFCSFTHNGITIPLCCAFVWLAFQRRERFFRQACWPMVIGVIIGTGLSLHQRWGDSLTATVDPEVMFSVTSIALRTLWETKVFVLSLALTGYLLSTRQGRKDILYIFRRHYVLTLCCLFSLFTLPFAPLGIKNAVTGVCFFSMFWLLFLCQHLIAKYLKRKI